MWAISINLSLILYPHAEHPQLNLEENQQEKHGLSNLGQSEPVPTSTIQDGWSMDRKPFFIVLKSHS
jgi:hypothetical protein